MSASASAGTPVRTNRPASSVRATSSTSENPPRHVTSAPSTGTPSHVTEPSIRRPGSSVTVSPRRTRTLRGARPGACTIAVASSPGNSSPTRAITSGETSVARAALRDAQRERLAADDLEGRPLPEAARREARHPDGDGRPEREAPVAVGHGAAAPVRHHRARDGDAALRDPPAWRLARDAEVERDRPLDDRLLLVRAHQPAPRRKIERVRAVRAGEGPCDRFPLGVVEPAPLRRLAPLDEEPRAGPVEGVDHPARDQEGRGRGGGGLDLRRGRHGPGARRPRFVRDDEHNPAGDREHRSRGRPEREPARPFREEQEAEHERAPVRGLFLEPRTELRERAVEPDPDGRGGDAEVARDLRRREPVVEVEDERGPVGLVEIRNRVDDPPFELQPRGDLDGRGRRIAACREQLAARRARAAPVPHERDVPRDPREPAAEVSGRRRLPDRGQERLLHDVLRVRLADYEPPREIPQESHMLQKRLAPRLAHPQIMPQSPPCERLGFAGLATCWGERGCGGGASGKYVATAGCCGLRGVEAR